jgi:hypothetical protein
MVPSIKMSPACFAINNKLSDEIYCNNNSNFLRRIANGPFLPLLSTLVPKMPQHAKPFSITQAQDNSMMVTGYQQDT